MVGVGEARSSLLGGPLGEEDGVRIGRVASEWVTGDNGRELLWRADDRDRLHAERVRDQAFELTGDGCLASRTVEEDVAACDVGADVAVAGLLEHRPELG